MNDIRRTILWVIFGFACVLLWDKWQVHNGNKAMFFPSTTEMAAKPAAASPGAAPQVAVVSGSGTAAVPTASTLGSAPPAANTGVPVTAVPNKCILKCVIIKNVSND